ncbi:periplasmic chaperone for outer membrane proteins SurA [Roseovarius halotolerans]|uniref:Parvulin-like PPIase n=1 Tax=Roseovarius halotolerans TaxID=505353 RepID=A0A1X6YKM6_9RHOB|nr:peptidylprolyl isomerase [Roseovarius halotolerans]RKT34385.1 periplasmic chaperone for outer membrane proteins SurA [Roseovarius halotolerans]SLN24092.1 Chaperone SurA precursor [Roseovarius halotolerans]
MRKFLAAIALPALAVSVLVGPGAAPAASQNLFAPVIKVNDQAITRYEIEQRARMLTLFRAPGNPRELAREQLIEERLKLDAARASGIVIEEEDIQAGMEEFASRANMNAEQFIRALEGAGVSAESYRAFVSAGLTWRELVGARFAPRVSVSEADIERARAAASGETGVRVLLSEIIMAAPPEQVEAVQERALRISQIDTIPAFAAEARRSSAASTRDRGGRLDWMPITNLPPQLRPVILGLAPGEVSDPLPLDGAIALFQMRDIEETGAAEPEYAAIEYAAYYIDGGRSDRALSRAARIEAETDTCDDLYGVAKGQPPEVLERDSRAPAEIPQDIALELAKLDPGEVSTTLTRANGETLVFLMLCGRTPELGEDGPSTEDLTNRIRNRRLDSFANGYLEQLRAEARIVELE